MKEEKELKFSVRTDLALEVKESIERDNVEVKGVIFEEEYNKKSEVKITRVKIISEEGVRAMGKPKGSYITLEAVNMSEPDEDYHREISIEIAGQLKEMFSKKNPPASFLIVGLGNREVTPDALGPEVLGNICITRHLIREFENLKEENTNQVSGIAPGVMAQTGMETLEILKGIIKETKPDLLIVIDALAARNTGRLNRTVQLTDTGINPGSGVGNYRKGLNKESLGVPVIAIGVPTVVDAATIVNDTMENLMEAMSQSEGFKGMKEAFQRLTQNEKYQLIRELIAPNLSEMFVTPKDIDETIKRLSYTISEALNIALELA